MTAGVVSRTVLAEQVLEHICRNDSVLLQALCQILSHDEPSEVLENFPIERSRRMLRWRGYLSLLGGRRIRTSSKSLIKAL